MAEAPKKHYLELGIEFCLELAIGLYQLGAEQMDLPHNFWVGLALWVAATALAVRMFWIFPAIERLNPRVKGVIAAAGIIALIFTSWTPVTNAYRKGRKPEVAAGPSDPQQSPPTSVNQNSQGSTNSPNTNVVGNNNTVNIGDPAVKARLDEITKLLKEQQGDRVTTEKLLAKYPLGFVIFDVNYTNSVFPYDSQKVLDKWDIDWKPVNLVDMGSQVLVTIPNFHAKNGPTISGIGLEIPKKVGPFPGRSIFNDGTIMMKGEVLAIEKSGVVFLFGFVKSPKE